MELLTGFSAARTVEQAWHVAREMLQARPGEPGARGAAVRMPWEIWDWYVHVAERATAMRRPLLAVRLAVFTSDWHERFVPNSGQSYMLLDQASAEQRRAIDNAAFEACYLLPPDELARTTHDTSVRDFHDELATRLGRPVDRMRENRAQAAKEAADGV